MENKPTLIPDNTAQKKKAAQFAQMPGAPPVRAQCAGQSQEHVFIPLALEILQEPLLKALAPIGQMPRAAEYASH